MRIKLSDWPSALEQFLENTRTGLVNARAAGIDTMPELEVEFQADIVFSVQALTQTTLTSEGSTRSETVDPSVVTEVTTEEPSTDTASQAGSEVTNRTTADSTTEVTHREATTANADTTVETKDETDYYQNYTS